MARTKIALALFAASLSMPARADEGDGVLALLPFTTSSGHVSIPVSVDDSDPFRIVLDTGMPTGGILLYASAAVDALELPFSDDRFSIAGAGGAGTSVEARVARPLDLTIGDVVVHKSHALVMPKPAGFARDQDGIVGAELFQRFVVRVDPVRRELQLIDPKRYEPPTGAEVVPVDLENGHAFVAARIAVGAGEPIDAKLVIDLGARHAMWLTGKADGPLAPPTGAIESSLGRGLSGEILGKVGRVRRCELGSLSFRDVIASFPSPEHQKPGGVDFKDGNLGAGLLLRIDVTFDFPHRRIVLRDVGLREQPFEYPMLGVVTDAAGDDGARVRRVLDDSPAEAAGIVAGDVLVAIDDAQLAAVDSDEIERRLTVDGALVSVRWVHDGRSVVAEVRLRRLV